MTRLASAAVLAPLVWVTIKLAPPWAFDAFVVVGVTLGFHELHRMLERRGARPFFWLGLLASWAVIWSFLEISPRFQAVAPIVAVCIVVCIAAMWRREGPAQMLEASLSTLFSVVFVGLGLSFLVGLRGMPGEDGEDLLLLLFLCVILADTVAYYVGSSFGRRRMAPRISPKKSWEGAICGVLGSIVGALLAHLWFFQRLPIAHAVILGVILGLAAILGDLAESLIKRASGIKDSSSLIPGHGGLLDRADSLLFSGPVLYYYYVVILQGMQ